MHDESLADLESHDEFFFGNEAEGPAYIACLKSVDGEATKIRIGLTGETLPSSLDVLSEVLATPGLSEDRHQYLDKEIAPFVSGAAQSALPW